MAEITTFFRKTPVASLKAYFATKSFTLLPKVDWSSKEGEVVTSLIEAVSKLADEDREELIREVNRIIALSDEAGQTALENVMNQREEFCEIDGGHNRALWALMNAREGFERAEEVRYNDEKRRGRMWSGFVVEPRKQLHKDETCRCLRPASRDLRWRKPPAGPGCRLSRRAARRCSRFRRRG